MSADGSIEVFCITWSVFALTLASWCPTAQAQVGKANQIFINRGLQLQGLVQYNDFFHLGTYQAANYTSINWGWTSAPNLTGPAPGFPWSRWVSAQTNMPPQNGEASYMSQLVMLQLADELNLNDDTTRTGLVNWFNAVETNFPNTILYANNYGGQVSDAALGDFIARAHPDMISFDLYPFKSDYGTGTPLGGPPTSFYSELRRYRAWGLGANIPFAAYMQTFHAVESYDSIIYRDPSPSELRLNTSAALAFNAKTLIGFTYNSGATSLFSIAPNGYSGDSQTNALYAEQSDANRRAINLGKALVCLKPVPEMHNPNDANPPPGPASGNVNFPDGTTTSILILKGCPGSTNPVYPPTPEPITFVDDPPLPNSASWWESGKNDPYFRGWVVTNLGTNNGGLPGQVIISWFRPLDESFDGPAYSNEVYIMVVNALTATNGTAADCAQEIRLNFAFSNGITAVNMLDPESGNVTTNTLPVVSGRNQLVLNLNGGDAALFKFADGAPFVGCVTPQKAKLGLEMPGGKPAINIQGSIGARYQIQSTTSLGAANWNVVSNVLLPSSPYVFTDGSYSGSVAMFYRVVGIP